MKINGVELEDLDIFEADIAEKYEQTLNEVVKKAKSAEGLKTSEAIRKQCEAVFDAFDSLFGEGTSKNVFGERVNLIICMKAFEELVEQINAKKEEIDKITSKYSSNRVQRRSKK